MLVNVNGLNVNYELTGPQDRPVVIFSHSLGASLRMWAFQKEALESHFRVLCYDFRGHGFSEACPGPYSLELLAEDAVGLLDALAMESVHWVGLSIGGMIGQAMALNHAHRLSSLVLADTFANVSEEAQAVWRDRIEAVRQQGVQPLLESTMERWFTPSFLRRNPPELEFIREDFLATTIDGYIGCSEAIRKLNYLNRLSEIHLPTLVMVGEEDPGAPLAVARDIHERISGSKLVVLPAARHLPNVERPNEFNAALLKFLRGL